METTSFPPFYPTTAGGGGDQQQYHHELNSIPPMSNTGVSIRQVTPPAYQSHHYVSSDIPTQIDFDHNADYPDGPGVQPPAYKEFDSQPCDSLNQRVYDPSTNQFYKATCLLLEESPDRAYWLQQQVRNAMYGCVWVGQLLQRPAAFGHDATITHWESTGQKVAIKQASLQLLEKAEALHSAEHPRREHAALTHLAMFATSHNQQHHHGSGAMMMETPAQAMERTGIMMPQDWLHDEHYAYLIMPYCNGGELFDRVGAQGRFSEDEARHWMHKILNSLEALHQAGVAHRDLSLENIMIHNDTTVIIDLGMSLPMPYDPHTGRRHLIASQGAAGKLKYMAPEVYAGQNNPEGFDGCAIDMWAVGVIMFIMLTGEMPWQFPDPTDIKFQKFTDGWIEPYLKGQGYPLSANAYCLLQRMLWLNPRDRLSIAQVRAHPWMRMGNADNMGVMPMFQSASKLPDTDAEGDAQQETVSIETPKKIQAGKYSKDEDVSAEDLSAMMEAVVMYQREEVGTKEEVSTSEATPLSAEDTYVKAMMAKAAIPASE